ncbi:hypothetical protein Hanom_Chr14g01328511 [Helianthus anomalus]
MLSSSCIMLLVSILSLGDSMKHANPILANELPYVLHGYTITPVQ